MREDGRKEGSFVSGDWRHVAHQTEQDTGEFPNIHRPPPAATVAWLGRGQSKPPLRFFTAHREEQKQL